MTDAQRQRRRRKKLARQKVVDSPKAIRRRQREAELAGRILALPDRRYGVILADPEWRFEVYSRETGLNAAADTHYPTSNIEVIAARDVPSIAASACVLFLWVTVPMLRQGMLVLEAWGFEYRSTLTWDKCRIGTGYWFRNQTEHLLVGVKGNVPAPEPGTQPSSLLRVMRGEHSAKPVEVLEMIERLYPNVPKIELNRRGPPRPGWDAWGNEVLALIPDEAAE